MKTVSMIILAIFIYSCCNCVIAHWTNNDMMIITKIMQHFSYRRATFIYSKEIMKTSIAPYIRKMSAFGIASNGMIHSSVLKMLDKSPSEPTVFITTLDHFEEFFNLDKNSAVRNRRLKEKLQLKVNMYGWLLWSEKANDFPSGNISIPFHVDVMVVEKHTTSYILWEQYTTQPGAASRNILGTALMPSSDLLFTTDLSPSLRRGMTDVLLTRGVFEMTDTTQILSATSEIISCLQKIFQFRLKNIPYVPKTDVFDLTDQSIIYSSLVPWIQSLLGPINQIRIFFYIRPQGEDTLSNYIVRPFHWLLWIALVVWIIVASLCTAINRLWTKNVPRYSLYQCAFTVFEAFCMQDAGDAVHKEKTIRMIIWLKVAIIIPAYSALIISFMTIRHTTIPFSNLQEMIDDGRYVYGGLKGTFMSKVQFIEPERSLVRVAAERFFVPSDDLPERNYEGVARACEDKHFAFLGYGHQLESFNEPCRLRRVPEPYYKTWITILTYPSFPYIYSFRQRLPMLFNNGIIHKLQGQLDDRKVESPFVEYVPVEFQLVRPVLFIIPIGLALSAAIFIIELLNFYCDSSWCKKLINPLKPIFNNGSNSLATQVKSRHAVAPR